MNKISAILLSVIILLGIGLLSFFAYNKHQETQIEKEKIKLELAKIESKEKNKKADAKQDKKTQANESKASEKTSEDKLTDTNLNKTAAECIWEEAFQNTQCNLDNYNTDELMEGYSTLIQEGALNGWCKPGGDPGNIKEQIKESIYNQQNNITCTAESLGQINEATPAWGSKEAADQMTEEDAINVFNDVMEGSNLNPTISHVEDAGDTYKVYYSKNNSSDANNFITIEKSTSRAHGTDLGN